MHMVAKARTRFALLLLTFGTTVVAAPVDLATGPLISGVTKTVPPNVYFILDDSSSMGYDYMPDSVGNNDNKNCFKNFGYNTIYYNPALDYPAPKNANGTDFADSNSTFTAAKNNGFASNSATTDLSRTESRNVTETVEVTLGNNPFTTSNNRNVTVTHNGHGLTNGTTITISGATRVNGVTPSGQYQISNVSTNSYRIQLSSSASGSGSGGGSNVVVSYTRSTTANVPMYGWYEYRADPGSPSATCAADSAYEWRWPTTAEEKRKFTNWYSYYRTRLLMMKSATGHAFAGIGDGFRVGYSAISEPGTTSTRFLKIARFDATHKATWYSRLYGAGCPSGTCYTPLRGALTKAGRLYAGKILTGNDDPVQYSCQQNFTILTTDGYWNTSDEDLATWYKAKKIDGTSDVGDQDGVDGVGRPYYESGKYSNTLADIAYYYYRSDLRPDTLASPNNLGGLNDDGVRIPVTKNNVPQNGQDTATWQHMTTFTLGLGVSGTLAYDENYLGGGSADYNAILQGTKTWPNPQTSSNSATVTARIDDLWHAAVNGRGRYLSAGNPDSLVTALQKTLASISVTNGSAAAASTSTLEPVAGDNSAYVAQYTSGSWYGDIVAREIILTTGALSEDVKWSARSQLATKVGTTTDTRSIYTFSATAANKLKSFESANLENEKSAGYFSSSATNPNGALTQYALWTTTQQGNATADAMIEFLRGRGGLEDQVRTGESTNDRRLFRDREHVLGDIVNAAPVYVKKPPFNYADAGYLDFVAEKSNPKTGRGGTVFAGANDGMLHAFDAATGAERWAYVPSMVIPMLYRLADAAYATNHRYYVDGPITVGDAYDAGDAQWKTVLIGGLGRGGQAYYALDVTDPDHPKALWEFGTAQDADMGYSYGNPVLTKRASDGKWVVLFASGYNNTAGDSKGRLYVLDAFSGEKLAEIVTSNSVTDPNLSGIAKVTSWVLNTLRDNSTQYVYGGDLSGALWRFDLSAGSSQRLGRTSATAGNLPITVRPEVGRIKDGTGVYHRVVYFGTGRYLGFGDLTADAPSSTVAQGLFAVKDTGTDLGVLTEPGANLVEQTLLAPGTDDENLPRTIPNPVPVNWHDKNGWFVRTPVGERINIDPRLQLGMLVAIANKPDDDYCYVGGESWLYVLDYRTGAAVRGQPVGSLLAASLAAGFTMMQLSDGLGLLVVYGDGSTKTEELPPPPPGASGLRRVSWREIF